MSCYLCGSNRIKTSLWLEPDKYEKLINLSDPQERQWVECYRCGLFNQSHELTSNDLDDIYLKYRDESMRHTTVKEEFDRIRAIPNSENNQRVNQLLKDGVLYERSVLDIGSGLGIFPYTILPYCKNVYCIEPNPESAKFINDELGMPCLNCFYMPNRYDRKFSLVTILHVLEHTSNPVKFLRQIRDNDLAEDGEVYIEVPDSCEFDYLNKNHDEFNSTHLFMFNVSTLDLITRKAGLKPFLIRRVDYPERKLSRIMLLAKSQR